MLCRGHADPLTQLRVAVGWGMDSVPSGPPPPPWTKGSPEYSMVSLILDVVQDPSGRVFSAHRLESPQDHETILQWSGGGLEQVAYALLVEAARREAVLGLLLMLSKEPQLLTALQASPERHQAVVETMAQALRSQFDKTLTRIAESVSKEALRTALT